MECPISEQNDPGSRKTLTEEIEITASQRVDDVKDLLAEGRVRQVRIKAPGGEVLVETPLTVGVLAGGAVALAAPWLAILGALAGLVARVKVEVVRDAGPGPADAPPPGGDAKA